MDLAHLKWWSVTRRGYFRPNSSRTWSLSRRENGKPHHQKWKTLSLPKPRLGFMVKVIIPWFWWTGKWLRKWARRGGTSLRWGAVSTCRVSFSARRGPFWTAPFPFSLVLPVFLLVPCFNYYWLGIWAPLTLKHRRYEIWYRLQSLSLEGLNALFVWVSTSRHVLSESKKNQHFVLEIARSPYFSITVGLFINLNMK